MQWDDPRFSLDEQLCFALYTASRAMTGCYRGLLRAAGLTYPQYVVLLVLWQHGAMTVGRLGEALQLESGTLSPLLKRLEAMGLIVRSRVPEDERSVLISLTPAGRELRERVDDVPTSVERATGMTRAEITELRGALIALAGRLRRAEAEPA